MTTSPSSSSPSTSYEVDSAALLKILLHGAKHPSSDVLGVLLGRPPKEAAAASASDGIDDVDASSAPSVSGRVVDALPLFHGPALYGPMLEVALLQAAAHAKSRDLSLLGVYAANELLSDDRLKPAVRAAAEAVARGTASASGSGSGGNSGSGGSGASGSSCCCVLLVNNGALASFSEGKADPEAGDALTLWLKKGGGGGVWERVAPPSSSSSPSSAPAPALLRGAGGEERAKLFAQAMARGLADRVHDFDDHLLDLKKDWLNPGLLA